MLFCCFVFGCCVSSFTQRRQRQNPFQFVVYLVLLSGAALVGYWLRADPNLVLLGYLPFATCAAMAISVSGHGAYRRLRPEAAAPPGDEEKAQPGAWMPGDEEKAQPGPGVPGDEEKAQLGAGVSGWAAPLKTDTLALPAHGLIGAGTGPSASPRRGGDGGGGKNVCGWGGQDEIALCVFFLGAWLVMFALGGGRGWGVVWLRRLALCHVGYTLPRRGVLKTSKKKILAHREIAGLWPPWPSFHGHPVQTSTACFCCCFFPSGLLLVGFFSLCRAVLQCLMVRAVLCKCISSCSLGVLLTVVSIDVQLFACQRPQSGGGTGYLSASSLSPRRKENSCLVQRGCLGTHTPWLLLRIQIAATGSKRSRLLRQARRRCLRM